MIPQDQLISPSARGIFDCLQQLAEEAATLDMPRTRAAIEIAVNAAWREAERSRVN